MKKWLWGLVVLLGCSDPPTAPCAVYLLPLLDADSVVVNTVRVEFCVYRTPGWLP
jgi:hypothetical protein